MSQETFKKRKWFDAWRAKFMNKNHYNYLCEIQRSLTKKKSPAVSFDLRQPSKRTVSAQRAASPVA
jgi:hypothetical protein